KVPGHNVLVRADILDCHAVAQVAGDDVAFVCVGSVVAAIGADAVAEGAASEDDAVAPVAQRGRTGDIGAYVVTGDDVLGGGIYDVSPVQAVARDDVSFLGIGDAVAVGADAVQLGPELEDHAPVGVAERGGAGGVGTNVIAGDRVVGAAGHEDAIAAKALHV